MSMPAELVLAAPHPTREAGLWLGAGAAVLAAHLAFAYVFQTLTDFVPLPEAMEEAMVIDLTPLPVTMPESVAAETLTEETIEPLEPVEELVEAVEPDPIEAEPVEPTEMAEADPLEAVEPEPETVQPEAVEEIQPEQVVPPEPQQEIVASEVVLPDAVPPPRARPVEEPAKKVETPVRKQTRPVAEKPRKTEVAETTKKAEPKPSASSRASKASTAPKVDPARWHSQVRAAVARRVGRIRGKSGTVNVRFVVSVSGAVISASVSRSSGDRSLDAAALSAIRSARVPAPPAGIGGGQHSFSIPLTFQ